jgi:trigger factor
MKILKQERRGDRHFLEIEASVATLNQSMDAAFQKLSKSAKIPGFRKGKVPRSLFEKHYGEGVLIQEGVSEAINTTYRQAIESLNLEVIDFPQNLKVTGEYEPYQPLVYSCEVDVLPEVKLGTYKGLSVKKEVAAVTDEALENRVAEILKYQSKYQVSTDPSKDGDILSLSIQATCEGQPYEAWSRQNKGVELGKSEMGEGFDAQLQGRQSGDELHFSISYPQDAPQTEVAGKTIDFHVTVTDVRVLIQPELNDEFVASFSEFKTVDEFKSDLRQKMQQQEEQALEEKFYQEVMETLLKEVEVDVQPILIQRQTDQHIEGIKQNLGNSGIKFEQYLAMINKTEADIRDEYKDQAKDHVKAELTLDAIAKAENFTVSEEEVLNEVKAWNIKSVGDDEAKLRQFVSRINTQPLTERLLRRKAMQCIIDNLKS